MRADYCLPTHFGIQIPFHKVSAIQFPACANVWGYSTPSTEPDTSPCWISGSSWYNFHVFQSPSGLKLCHLRSTIFPYSTSFGICWKGAHPLSHHSNHWWRHWKVLDIFNTLFLTDLQLDVKPLIMTHFRPGITTIFQAHSCILQYFLNLKIKMLCVTVWENVTWDRIYSPLSFYSHSQSFHQVSFFQGQMSGTSPKWHDALQVVDINLAITHPWRFH